MIVPTSRASVQSDPTGPDLPPQKGGPQPSDANLLMAAATMHQMGRLGPMRPGKPPMRPMTKDEIKSGEKPFHRSLQQQREMGDEQQPDYVPIDQLGLRG